MPLNLDSWLQHIAAVHVREIELGLDRVREVARRLGLRQAAAHTVVIAGTNGKGSCVRCLEAAALAAGWRVGSYTSPHLHRFNERIRINGQEAGDDLLCEGFAAVEAARQGTPLTYFEFATLLALLLFEQAELDVALLEVGLGGRLDAVNIVDGDVTVITSISLDHQDWLGPDTESIAAEKAGILRAATPLVYGDRQPAASILERAAALKVPLYLQGRDYWIEPGDSGASWHWHGRDRDGQPRQLADLPPATLFADNVATALQVLALLPQAPEREAVCQALAGLKLAGRWERGIDQDSGVPVLLDVAHNPAAAELLAAQLKRLRRRPDPPARIAAVLAVMADKDIEAMVSALESWVDFWYIAQVDQPRCLPADTALCRLRKLNADLPLQRFDSVEQAYRQACASLTDTDLLVVTGSFYTVAAVRHYSTAASGQQPQD